MVAQNRTKLAIPELGDVPGQIMVRSVEFLFADTNVQLFVLHNKQWESEPGTQTYNKTIR